MKCDVRKTISAKLFLGVKKNVFGKRHNMLTIGYSSFRVDTQCDRHVHGCRGHTSFLNHGGRNVGMAAQIWAWPLPRGPLVTVALWLEQ